MDRMSDIISNFSVRIIQGFSVKHDSAWTEKKIKPDYTIWSVVQGNITIITNGVRYEVHEGDGVLFCPGIEYYAETDKDGCEFVVVHFSLQTGNGMDLFSGVNVAGIASGENLKTKEFCSLFMKNHPVAVKTSFEQYVVFINYIYEIIKIQKSRHAVLFYKNPHDVSSTIMQKAVDYILQNYKSITVRQVAAHVYMNEKRFISNFKKTVGMSPGQFISHCKMRKAAELISTTDIKLSEAASYLGFADQYSFSKAFKRAFGYAPSEFRKN